MLGFLCALRSSGHAVYPEAPSSTPKCYGKVNLDRYAYDSGEKYTILRGAAFADTPMLPDIQQCGRKLLVEISRDISFGKGGIASRGEDGAACLIPHNLGRTNSHEDAADVGSFKKVSLLIISRIDLAWKFPKCSSCEKCETS